MEMAAIITHILGFIAFSFRTFPVWCVAGAEKQGIKSLSGLPGKCQAFTARFLAVIWSSRELRPSAKRGRQRLDLNCIIAMISVRYRSARGFLDAASLTLFRYRHSLWYLHCRIRGAAYWLKSALQFCSWLRIYVALGNPAVSGADESDDLKKPLADAKELT
jgi:hypothetical protein